MVVGRAEASEARQRETRQQRAGERDGERREDSLLEQVEEGHGRVRESMDAVRFEASYQVFFFALGKHEELHRDSQKSLKLPLDEMKQH